MGFIMTFPYIVQYIFITFTDLPHSFHFLFPRCLPSIFIFVWVCVLGGGVPNEFSRLYRSIDTLLVSTQLKKMSLPVNHKLHYKPSGRVLVGPSLCGNPQLLWVQELDIHAMPRSQHSTSLLWLCPSLSFFLPLVQCSLCLREGRCLVHGWIFSSHLSSVCWWLQKNYSD